MSGSGDGQSRIVVGVDGSEGSKDALRWAARQSELTGATLEVVTGWDYPAFYGWAPAIPDDVNFGHFAQRAQDEEPQQDLRLAAVEQRGEGTQKPAPA